MLTRSLQAVALAAALLCCAPARAEWGIGYAREWHGVNLDPAPEDTPLFLEQMPEYAGASFSMQSNRITIFDSSGVLLAGLGTAANREVARRRAEESARERGAKVGDSYSFTYDNLAPVPGHMTELRVFWGSGSGITMRRPGLEVSQSSAELSMWGFDLIAGMKSWSLLRGFEVGVALDANWTSFTAKKLHFSGETLSDEASWDRFNLSIGVPVSYSPFPSVSVSLIPAFDPLFSGVRYLLRKPAKPAWIEASLGLQANLRPFSFLLLQIEATGMQSSTIDQRSMTVLRVNAGIALMFGES